MYDILSTKHDIDRVLLKNPLKVVLLQFPDGLLDKFSIEIVNFLKNKEIQPIIAGDPSYGACDLPLHYTSFFGENMKISAIFHFGHSTFAFPKPLSDVEIYYFEVKADIKIDWVLIKKELDRHNWKKIGLLTTIQHTTIINDVKDNFGSEYEFIIHKEGQILGCNQDRAKKIADQVEGFLVIAGGNFHASPVVVATGKETLRYDPFNKNFHFFDLAYRNSYLKKRYASIIKARKAKIWGVLLSLKSGQFPKDSGERIISMLEEAGKTAILVPMTRIDAQHLINYNDIEAWVISLCPRVATDDYVSFNKPILTVREMMVTLDLLDWDVFTNSKLPSQLLTIDF